MLKFNPDKKMRKLVILLLFICSVCGQVDVNYRMDTLTATLPNGFSLPNNLFISSLGNIFFSSGEQIKKLEASSGEVKTLCTSNELSALGKMFVTVDEKVFILNPLTSTIFVLTSEGNLTIVAGNYTTGYGGDGGPAVLANFN